MEPPPFPANPASNHKMLHDLCTFVGGVANPDISYSSVISIPSAPGGTDLSDELKSRDTIACAVKGCDGARGRKLSRTFRMIEGSAAVKLIWQLVACSTWTHAQFVFYDDSHFGPGCTASPHNSLKSLTWLRVFLCIPSDQRLLD